MVRELIEIKILDENVLGYLKTADGLVVLLKKHPETFEIAHKMLEICKKKSSKVVRNAPSKKHGKRDIPFSIKKGEFE